MSETTQPSASGITAQEAKARVAVTSGRKQEQALVRARRDHRLLEHELEKVGEGLQQPPWPDDVRTAAHLHRRPDLAVGVERIGDVDEERDEEQQALPDNDQDGEDDVPEAHGLYSAASSRRSRARPEHSAMTRGGAGDRVREVEVEDRAEERLARRRAAAKPRVPAPPRRRRPARWRRSPPGAGARHRASAAAAAASRRAAGARARPRAPAGSPSPRGRRPAGRRRGLPSARGLRC